MLGLVAVQALSSCGERGATLHCGARASHCGGFSSCRAQALGTQASVVVACGLSCSSRALERRLRSCGTRALVAHGMWNLPRPGIEPCPLHWQVDSSPLYPVPLEKSQGLFVYIYSHTQKYIFISIADGSKDIQPNNSDFLWRMRWERWRKERKKVEMGSLPLY